MHPREATGGRMIYFVHIPKTAGTSLRKLLTQGAGADSVAYVYLPPDGLEESDLCSRPADRIAGLRVVYGHFAYGLDRRLGRPGTYLTCLRETAPRLVSNYFHHVRSGFAGDLSLQAYFESCKPKDMDNYAVRLIAGIGEDVPFGGVTRHHLEQARRNLATRFAAFGLYEFLPESIARFRRVTGLAPVELGRENATPPAQTIAQIPAEEIDCILRHNELDDELYAFARAEFLKGLA